MASLRRVLAALAALLAAASADFGKVTPVEKVITLLEDLEAEVKEEGTKEAGTYDEYACFCKTTTGTKSDSIMNGQDTIDTLSAGIAEDTATVAGKKTELQAKKKEVEELSAELDSVVASCLKEAAEFEAEMADLTKACNSLDKALQAMQTAKGGGASLLQSNSTLREEVGSTLAIAEAMSLVEAPKRRAVLAFMQGRRVDPNNPEYKFHSDGIISVLEKLKTEFDDKKSETHSEMEKAAQICTDSKTELTGQIDGAKAEITTLETDIDTLKTKIAEDRASLVEAEDILKDDKVYLKDLTAQCESSAREWDQRSQARGQELEVLAEALMIIRDGGEDKKSVKDLETDAGLRSTPTTTEVNIVKFMQRRVQLRVATHQEQASPTPAPQLYEYVGCYEGNNVDRPCGDTPSTMDGVQECRDCCASKGYTYFGFECPHDDGGETHCECGNEGATTGTALDEDKCSEFNSASGGHCSGPFTLTGSIGTYLLGAGSIGVVYRTQASSTPAPPTPASAPVAQLYEYVGCYEGNNVDRPCGDTPSTMDGVQECRDCCASKGYTYFGFECPHDDGGETHCECGNEGATTGTALDEEKCSEFNSASGGHCSGPFSLTGSIGTYLLGAGSIGAVYRTQASPTPAPPTQAVDGGPRRAPPSFLQQGARSAGLRSTSSSLRQAEELLRDAGIKLKSAALTAMAASLRKDPFAKVKTMIQNLIVRLLDEAKKEATKQGFCDTELGKAYKTREFRLDDAKKLAAELGLLRSKNDTLGEEIVLLEEALPELRDTLNQTTRLRAQEKVENMDRIKASKDGYAAVTEAIVLLKTYYKSKARALLQARASPVDEDTQGPGFSGSYRGKADGARGIIGLLEVIKSDFDRAVRTTREEEEKAQREFVEFEQTSKEDIAGKEKSLELKQEDQAMTISSIEKGLEKLTTTQGLVDDAIKTVEDLKPMCLDMGQDYQTRVQKREEEIAALREALTILTPAE